ncbi:3'-5' exonuclease [Myxococcus sp. K15C18031901]|uniref:3'-5' exonuclease n=1 Tax=Myxococcus dinghuensis TaxID=2906761 RepID=UPI0020A7F0B8|nr:3'-5' exonuclease [Myxococcus dinghuensis]MCP3104498.1 3'-5' exonuclease [Myxococcus dinghuensis]
MKDPLFKPWNEASFVAVDIEGNGYNPAEIIEISTVLITPPGIAQRPTTWLVRPAHKISRRVTAIHGIRNKDVASAPTIDSIRDELSIQLSDHYFIAHYAHVDHEVLKRQLPAWEPRAVIDTAKLARRLLPRQDSYRLTAIIDTLGLEEQLRAIESTPHRATYDAFAAALIFLRLCKTNSGRELTLSEILDTTREPSQKQRDLFT